MLEELSLILPVYNEVDIIGFTLNEAIRYLEQKFKKYEIIVVDDGSSDGSAAIIKKIAAQTKNVVIIKHKQNKGYGCALRSGFKAASLDYIFFMDSDGQFRIQDFDSIRPYISDYDMVVCYRQERKDSLFRNFLGALFTKTMDLCFRLPFKDINCAYKLVKRRQIQSLYLKIEGPLINAEILIKSLRKGLRVKECPIPHFPRQYGQPTGAKVTTIVRAFRDFFYLAREL